jgi:hypothetical protein
MKLKWKPNIPQFAKDKIIIDIRKVLTYVTLFLNLDHPHARI